MDKYPLEWGWHTAPEAGTPDASRFIPVMPTLLGGADPGSLGEPRTSRLPPTTDLVRLAPKVPPPGIRREDLFPKRPFKPNVIIPWELHRPEIDIDFPPLLNPPPQDDGPPGPTGYPGDNIG